MQADIAAMADIPLDELASLLHKRAHGRLTNPWENAEKLYRVAQDSYPLAQELAPAVQMVLQHTLAHIDFLEKQKKRLQQHLAAALESLLEAEPALARLAGLGWPQNSSGRFVGQDPSPGS